MTAKEIQPNKDIKATDEAAALDVKVPANGVDAAAVIAEAPASKVTLGRKMRENAAGGAPGARRGAPSGDRRGGKGSAGRRSGGDSRERVKPEFDSKIIDIRRVTRVTSGGRRMNFSVAVVAGDRKGRVGVGLGKSVDTAGAVEKATREAKKNLIKVPLSAQMVIPHSVEAKYGSARIMIFPARGRGVVAGSSARAVIELAGIRDVCAKFLSGSKNRLNNARVAVEALKKLSTLSRDTIRGRAPKVDLSKEGKREISKDSA